MKLRYDLMDLAKSFGQRKKVLDAPVIDEWRLLKVEDSEGCWGKGSK